MPGTRASYPLKQLLSASSQHSFQFTSKQQVHLLPVAVLSDKHPGGQLVSPLLGIAFSRCILVKNASYWGPSQPYYS